MKQKLIITLFANLFAFITFAQNTIVARVQPRILNLDVINDKPISSASFENVLNARGLKLLDSLDVSLRKLNCVKMFTDITTMVN